MMSGALCQQTSELKMELPEAAPGAGTHRNFVASFSELVSGNVSWKSPQNRPSSADPLSRPLPATAGSPVYLVTAWEHRSPSLIATSIMGATSKGARVPWSGDLALAEPCQMQTTEALCV